MLIEKGARTMNRTLWVIGLATAMTLSAAPRPAAAAVPQAPAVPVTAVQLVGWGVNHAGALTVGRLVSPVQVAAGSAHVLVLQSDGTVVGTGEQGWSQAFVPSGLDHVVAVAAGGMSSAALKSDGSVVGWGYLDKAWMSGLSHVKAIAVANQTQCAVLDDGTTTSPTGFGTAPATTDAVSVAAGSIGTGNGSCLALRSDGTVVGWGDNAQGQTSIPPGLTGVSAVADGETFGIAVLQTGRVVSWGSRTDLFSSVTNAVGVAAALGRVALVLDDGRVLDADTEGGVVSSSSPVIGAISLAV